MTKYTPGVTAWLKTMNDVVDFADAEYLFELGLVDILMVSSESKGNGWPKKVAHVRPTNLAKKEAKAAR